MLPPPDTWGSADPCAYNCCYAMRRWPQSSQLSGIWPPSAAVRQVLDRRHHLELGQARRGRHAPRARLVHEHERYRRPRATVAAGLAAARVLAFHQQPEMLGADLSPRGIVLVATRA